MGDLSSLLPIVVSLLFKSAEKGTLIEIVETAAKLVHLLEPVIAALPSPDRPHTPTSPIQGPET